MHDPAHYLVLMAPAVTFLVALSNRQARISTITRENCRTICELIGSSGTCETDVRVRSLIDQNELLFQRYRLIQVALVLLCIGLLVLGVDAFTEFFLGDWWLFWSGVLVMGFGTGIIVWELLRAADTISHEVACSKWMALRDKKDLSSPPAFRRFAIICPLRDYLVKWRARRSL